MTYKYPPSVFYRAEIHEKMLLNMITVISGRLPAGNVLIFLQTVAGAGYRKVRVMW